MPPAAPTLYMVMGISFSGKSVLARAIQKQMDISRVDPDEVGHERGLGRHGEFLSPEQWREIHAEARRRASALLDQGRSLVYDTVLFDRAQRNELRHLAGRHGAQSVLVWVDTPRDVALARWHRNNLTHERALVHRDDFDLCARQFVPPDEHEAHLRFRWNEDLKGWLDCLTTDRSGVR